MKVAYAMAGQTGIGHRYFLEDRLPPKLNIEHVRARYKRDELHPKLNVTAGGSTSYRLEYFAPVQSCSVTLCCSLPLPVSCKNSGCESSGFSGGSRKPLRGYSIVLAIPA